MTVCHREMIQSGVVAERWWHRLDDGRIQCGIKRVAVTAGYINPEPRRVFCAYMDAAKVDLKAFTGVDLGTERSAMIPERNSPSGMFFTPSGASNTRRMAGC